MVDAMTDERDALHQIHLQLIRGDDALQEGGALKSLRLGDCGDRTDEVAGMA